MDQHRSASARRQAWHRQSSPSAGIGSFAVSSMHQQCPDRSQVKGVPQRAQFSVRCAAGPDGLVTIPFTFLSNPSCDVHAPEAHNLFNRFIFGQPVGEINREIQQWRVTRKALSSHSTGSDLARAAARPAIFPVQPLILAGS
jgi:hypothetical protein